MNFDWSTAWQLAQSKAWIPFAIFVVGYLVRITADDSKFPINIPHQWHAVTALVLADTLNVLTSWPDWKTAFHPYYFGKTEPVWFRWLARIVPDPPADKSGVQQAKPVETADLMGVYVDAKKEDPK